MYKTIHDIQNGNKELLNDFIIENIEYIHSFIKEYKNKISNYDELEQDTILEFVRAIYTFKFNNDFYIAHTRRRLNTHVLRFMVKNLEKIIDDDFKYIFATRLYERCKKNIKKDPNIKDLSKFYYAGENYSEKLLDIINYENECKNVPYEDSYIRKIITIENAINSKVDMEKFTKEVIEPNLTNKQKRVILLKYGFLGECNDMHEIAKIIGVSRQDICEKHKRAIKKLRKKLNNY